MESLKNILGEHYDEFCATIDSYNESNPENAVKLVNIADGGYVEQNVYDELARQLETMQGQAGEAERTRGEYEQTIQKLEAELCAGKFDNAVDVALIRAGAKNLKAAKALLDLENLPKDDDGMMRVHSRIEQIREECAYLFSGAASATGMRQGGLSRGSGAADELRNVLFGKKK